MKRRSFVRLFALLGMALPVRLSAAFADVGPETIFIVDGWILKASDIAVAHRDH